MMQGSQSGRSVRRLEDARFLLVATPSGVSLAGEGGAHQSIASPLIGMSQDGLASFEPAFADELSVLMDWGFDYMQRDGSERADLAATLLAWLSRHGQVDAAAADLGVHRHTVRHRLRRAEGLLGRSLDDAGVRAELDLALTRQPD